MSHLRSLFRHVSPRQFETAASVVHDTSRSLLRPLAAAVAARGSSAVAVAHPYSTASRRAHRPTTMSVHRHHSLVRFLSTTETPLKQYDQIHILYASQTGTAQLFAMQLQGALQEENKNAVVDCHALSEVQPSDLFGTPKNALSLFLVSTTGVGEFPDNGREFYKKLLEADDVVVGDYSMFALGNSAAHPHHFCAAAKVLEETLQHRGQAVMPLELGDDGDEDRYLEDVYDQWQERVVQMVVTGQVPDVAEQPKAEKGPELLEEVEKEPTLEDVPEFEHRSAMYPELHLKAVSKEQSMTTTVRSDLLDVCPDFYAPGSQRLTVVAHQALNPDPSTVSGLREICFALPEGTTYEAGDHLLVYPRNSDIMVEAYLALLEDNDGNPLDPSMIIQGPGRVDPSSGSKARQANYPHPTGITVYETLSHFVDLEAIPSPSFARWITGKGRDLDFKNKVAIPRRTVLDLLLEHQPPSKLSLQDLLYNLPALQPRYYSIASSARVHPHTVFLTYRPVHYLSTRGAVRNGLCTSHLQRIPNHESGTQVVAALRSNPLFRLPSDPNVPIVLIAGGCGVAPIRAFLEELVANQQCDNNKQPHPRNVHLFLGFRNPNDQVYLELVEEARDMLATRRITFNTGCPDPSQCGLISDALRQEAHTLLPLLLVNGATAPHFYVCGGARAFGVAIERAFHDILSTELETEEKATERLRELLDQKRLHEDLSD